MLVGCRNFTIRANLQIHAFSLLVGPRAENDAADEPGDDQLRRRGEGDSREGRLARFVRGYQITIVDSKIRPYSEISLQ